MFVNDRSIPSLSPGALVRVVPGLLVLAALLGGCGGGHHDEHHEELSLPVTSALRTDTAVTRDYVCQVRSAQHIELRALERGYLQDIHVDEGQRVKEGQLMFRIRPVLYQADVQRAKAEVEYADIEYRNTKALADSNIVSPVELAMAKARLDKAKAELAVAEAHLGFTEIRAPFDGIMDRFHVRQGSLLDEGELLTEISDNSSMWVYFNVPEAEYLGYMRSAEEETGLKVRLRLANGEVFEHEGSITAIEADFDSRTGNIAFRATFPNPDGLLRHGETGNILMSTPLQGVQLIPQKATFEVLDQRYVYVVGEDGEVVSRRIHIAQELPHLFVVSDGLEPDDRFLLEGLRKVREGQHIGVRYLPPDSVLGDLELYAE